MKNIIILTLIISNLFSYEIYKEIKINNADDQLINTLNQLQVDLDHVHLENDNSIQFAISESDLSKIELFNICDDGKNYGEIDEIDNKNYELPKKYMDIIGKYSSSLGFPGMPKRD